MHLLNLVNWYLLHVWKHLHLLDLRMLDSLHLHQPRKVGMLSRAESSDLSIWRCETLEVWLHDQLRNFDALVLVLWIGGTHAVASIKHAQLTIVLGLHVLEFLSLEVEWLQTLGLRLHMLLVHGNDVVVLVFGGSQQFVFKSDAYKGVVFFNFLCFFFSKYLWLP